MSKQVFVDQHLGYVKKGSNHIFYNLKRAFNGLIQAPQIWYSRIDTYFN